MSSALNVLAEEQARLERLRGFYQEKIAALPAGNLSRKQRGERAYCYRVVRTGGKVRWYYVGKPDSEAVRQLQAQLDERRRYEALLKQTEQELARVKRALR
jgi:hypothetical protein